jgi:hypothetical protein
MKRRLGRTWSRVHRPAVWGACYVLLIPLFGFLYIHTNHAFSQPGIQVERSSLRALKTDVAQALKADFADALRNPAQLSVDATDDENGRFKFFISWRDSKHNTVILYSLFVEEATYGGVPPFTYDAQAGERYGMSAASTRRFSGYLRPTPSLSFKPQEGTAWLSLVSTGRLKSALDRLQYAKEGDPVEAAGATMRMLYFSTETITTLGFGDIVPTTQSARTLVMVESFLGILTAGLFLASIGSRAAAAFTARSS